MDEQKTEKSRKWNKVLLWIPRILLIASFLFKFFDSFFRNSELSSAFCFIGILCAVIPLIMGIYKNK